MTLINNLIILAGRPPELAWKWSCKQTK